MHGKLQYFFLFLPFMGPRVTRTLDTQSLLPLQDRDMRGLKVEKEHKSIYDKTNVQVDENCYAER